MISRKVCFVFGAGVSCSYNFLTGRGHWHEMCTALADRQSTMSQTLVEAGFQPGEVENFGRQLTYSQSDSIDRFIENRNEWSAIGKAAIAAALIPRESLSHVVNPTQNERIYEYIWHRMGPSLEDFVKNNLSVITFNYDRSFEIFMLYALTHAYGLPHPKAEEVFRGTVPLVHVYGQLNALSYAHGDGMPYGAAPNKKNIITAAENIEIVGKNRALSEQVKSAQKLISAAEVVFFLGFGYDKINLERLGLVPPQTGKEYLGTAYGLEDGERHIVQTKLFGTAGGITLGGPGTDAYTFLRQRAHVWH